jgi:hypothetical protein
MKNYLITIVCCMGVCFATIPEQLVCDATRGEWSLAVLSDTQNWVEQGNTGRWDFSRVEDSFQWMLDNKGQLNLKVVQAVGDMMQYNTDYEWERVRKIYYLMLTENGIPGIPAAGNHEWKDGGGSGDFRLMNEYLPVSEYEKYSWWGGCYPAGKIQNSYQLFTIGKEDYLFINMQYQAGSVEVGAQAAVDWAVSIMEQYPERKIIFTSHWHTDQHHIPQTIDVFDNIVMTLAGHECPPKRDWYTVSHARTHNFIHGFSCETYEGLMHIRFYKFKPMEDKVEWYTYSVVANNGAGAFWPGLSNGMDFPEGEFDLVQEDPDPTAVVDDPKNKSGRDMDISMSSAGQQRTITFNTAKRTWISLSLYDSQGRLVKNVYRKSAAPGSQTVRFDTTPYAPGIYYLQGDTGRSKLVKKFAIVL